MHRGLRHWACSANKVREFLVLSNRLKVKQWRKDIAKGRSQV
jgi:hypothetical protein